MRWVTVWTHMDDEGPIVLNELLDTLHPSLNALDSQVVCNIANFITMELEPFEVEVELVDFGYSKKSTS
jgi:hypothetical protein